MLVKRGEEGFWDTFTHYRISEEWQHELYNFIILGYHPGSFHTAIFSNASIMDVACKSHPSNDWQAITGTAHWLMHVAPANSWGSREKVAAWIDLSQDERRKICEEKRFVLTEQELAWELLSTK